MFGLLPIPNLVDTATIVLGGVGSKWLGRTVFPQAAGMLGGWGSPLLTLGVGVGAAFLAPMVGMRRFAKPIATGAAFMAALDALKLTPFGAQLGIGSYYSPGGYEPVVSGVGEVPNGFLNPNELSQGDENAPSGFLEEDVLY